MRPGDRVAVFGCGGVGLSAILGALAVGADPIVAVDVAPAKLEAALALGATHAVEWAGGPDETADRVFAAAGGGVDYAIEATGRTEAARAAFLSTRARGAAVLVGIPAADAEMYAPGALDPADGAARARLDLRLGAARARLPRRCSRLYRSRPPAARPADHRAAAARGRRRRVRSPARRQPRPVVIELDGVAA